MAFLFQSGDNLRPEFGHVVRSKKAVVGLIYNVGNIIIKQGIHNLCHCAVFGQFVNVMLDVGIQILQAGDQKIRVFPDRISTIPGLSMVPVTRLIYGINVALVLDLFAVCNVQQQS